MFAATQRLLLLVLVMLLVGIGIVLLVVTFIHSLCQDDCPFMVEQIKGALNEMPGSGQGIPAIGVSVAPNEDTAASSSRFTG